MKNEKVRKDELCWRFWNWSVHTLFCKKTEYSHFTTEIIYGYISMLVATLEWDHNYLLLTIMYKKKLITPMDISMLVVALEWDHNRLLLTIIYMDIFQCSLHHMLLTIMTKKTKHNNGYALLVVALDWAYNHVLLTVQCAYWILSMVISVTVSVCQIRRIETVTQ